MEKREEIKDGVKQRIIEYMAEQITKEESFATLKSELIEEFLSKKEIKTPVINEVASKSLDTFSVVAAKAENSFQKIKDRQADNYKKIIDVKLGKNTNQNVLKMIKSLSKEDSPTYTDVIDMITNKNVIDYNEFIIDPRLKSDFTEEKKKLMRDSSLEMLREILKNPFSNTLKVSVNRYSNEENYCKSYSVNDEMNKFIFECSYVYNDALKQTYIDKFFVDSKGFLLTGKELEIPFALEAMNIIDQAEVVRQKAINIIERKSESVKQKAINMLEGKLNKKPVTKKTPKKRQSKNKE